MQHVQASTGRLTTGDIIQRQAQHGGSAQAQSAAQAGQPRFSALVTQILQRKPAASTQNTLEDLMADLDDEERGFAEDPSKQRYESYRKAVKALCSMLLSRGYRLQGWEDKRKRRYEIVKTIDARLAQVYSGLLRRNQDVVIALHLMGQIRGLIFDLQA